MSSPASSRAASPSGAFWTFAFVLTSIACVFPIFRVAYLPIQDLPQHLAAVRVLHDYGDAQLGFAELFTLDLLRTQYLTVYLAAHLLAYVLPLELAMRVITAAILIATPWAMRALLRSLGKDERLALLAFPLAYNAHLILGFLNFLGAIPLALWGIALAVQQRTHGASTRRSVLLALIGIACFYSHVVPFAFLGLGVVLVSFDRDLRATLRRTLPLVPSALAALAWLRTSAAGQATLTAARGEARGKRLEYTPVARAWEELPRWLTDVLAGDADTRLLHAWLAVIALALLAPLVRRMLGKRAAAQPTVALPAPAHAPASPLALRVLVLAPLAALLYFVTPTSYDWIWPIAQRFPLMCALLLILWLPRLQGVLGHVVLSLALVISLASFHFTGSAFGKFSREEVGDLDAALEVIPQGKRVAGLIFHRGSRYVAFSPFIHAVAYYQARKGGAVMFTFADFPQSPFRFREHDRPPRVPPRWEWTPERVRPERDLAWYDYVLVRGGPGRISSPGSGFERRYRGRHWSVFARQVAPSASSAL